MSWSQGFPNTFSPTQQTNEVLKNLDNETKRIYSTRNQVMASDGHAHTGNGSDGAKITASNITNSPAGNIVSTTVQAAVNELDGQITGLTIDGIKVGTGTRHGTFSIVDTRTTIDWHGFEDERILNTTDTGMGYASFDAQVRMNNPNDQNHFVGYQSRGIYNGTGALTTYMHGYDTAMQHTGTGLINFVAGMRIRDIGGSGPVLYNYGLYVEPITRGSYRYAIYSGNGNTHYLGGTTGIVTTGAVLATGFNFGVDTAGKTITYGFGSTGQTNYGKHEFYDGKNTVITTIDRTGVKPPVYTFATLPAATEGAFAYCSNGRKVGETAGNGTGVPVYFSGSVWRVFSTDAIVTS